MSASNPFYRPRRAIGHTRPGTATRSLAVLAVGVVCAATVSPSLAAAESVVSATPAATVSPTPSTPAPTPKQTVQPAGEDTIPVVPVDPPTEAPTDEPTQTTEPSPEPSDTDTPSTPTPAITMTPKAGTVVPGSSVAVDAAVTGIDDGATIRVELVSASGEVLGHSTVEVTGGQFSATINLDADAAVAPGEELTLRNDETDDTAAVTVAERTVQLVADDVTFGDTVKVTGTGLPVKQTAIYLDEVKVDTVNPGLDDGAFSAELEVATSGSHTVRVGTGEPLPFTVHPGIAAHQARIWDGDTVTLTSRGWPADADVEFTVEGTGDSPTLVESHTADAAGAISFELAASDFDAGLYTVTAAGTNRVATFRVMNPRMPDVHVNPGKAYTIRAFELRPFTEVLVSIKLDGQPLGEPISVTADENGTLTLDGVAPEAEGTYTIETDLGLVANLDVAVPDPEPTPTPTVPVEPTLPPVTPTPTPTPTDVATGSNLDDDDDPTRTVVDTIVVDTDPDDATPTPQPTVEPTGPTPSDPPTGSPTPSAQPTVPTDGDNIAMGVTLAAGGVLVLGSAGALGWHFLRRPRGARIAGK